MNEDYKNDTPENFDSTYTNDPIYLLARYKAYCDLFKDDEIERYKEVEGITED